MNSKTRSQNIQTNPNSHITTGAVAFGVSGAISFNAGSVIAQKARQI